MSVWWLILCWLLLLLCSAEAQRGAYQVLLEPQDVLQLPDLPYSYDALSPYLDAATLRVHHQGHHKAYTDKTNSALQQWREQDLADDSLSQKSIVEILQHLSEVPEQWRTKLRNNGGGFVNHVFYWETMCPTPQGVEPAGKLAEDIAAVFGGFEAFKSAFTTAATNLFGSGYVWLCEDNKGDLLIVPTQNQDSPLSSGLYPLLVLDVWEHAYYLKHQNKRANYVTDWWQVVCWESVSEIRQFWHKHNSLSPHQEL